MKYVNLTYRISRGRQAAMSQHYFPFRATYLLFSLPAAMMHHYFPFRTSVLYLEISQSLMIIQLLSHYTKSILKSLINQLSFKTI